MSVEMIKEQFMVSVKLSRELYNMLEEMCERTKLRKSDILRMAIAYYYYKGNWRELYGLEGSKG